LGLVFLVELLLDSRELSTFELGDLDRLITLGGMDKRAEHGASLCMANS
jgi:hypothetical protein